MKIMNTLILSFLMLLNLACSKNESPKTIIADSIYAVVESATVSGNEGSYTFSITLKSPDKGCNQYANWWEVITENEELVYRRILGHSHVNEQPFTRSGGSVKISATDIVIIRGHMNTTGYGEGKIGLKGSVESGFEPYVITKEFGAALESESPQPTGCAF